MRVVDRRFRVHVAPRVLLTAVCFLFADFTGGAAEQAFAQAQPSIQEQVLRSGSAIEAARLKVSQAAFIYMHGDIATAEEQAVALARPAYLDLRRLVGPDDPDTVIAGRYVVMGALRSRDYLEAERISRERVQSIPRALAALPQDWSSFTSNQVRRPQMALWEAYYQLGDALFGQRRWNEAIQAGKAALADPDVGRVMSYKADVHGLLADAMQMSGSEAWVREGVENRLSQLRIIKTNERLCTPFALRLIQRLALMPTDPATDGARAAFMQEARATCPAQAEQMPR